MKIVASLRDVKWSFFGVLATMAFNVITLPLMLLFIDSENMGVWYVFVSIGSLATLFDMGFAVTFSRMIAYGYGGASDISDEIILINNNGEIDPYFMFKILKICRMIYLIISTVVLGLLLTIGSYYISYITRDIRSKAIIVAWIIYMTAIYFNILFGYYTSLLRGTGAVSQANINMIVGRMVQLIILVVLLFIGCGLIAGSLAYLLYTVVFRSLSRKYIRQLNLFNNSSIKINKDELKELFFKIWNKAWKEGAIAISMYATNQASTLICSLFLTLEETAAYSLATQLAMMISQISAVYFSSVQPSLQNAYARNDRTVLQKNMAASSFFCLAVFIVLSALLLTAGVPILVLMNHELVLPIPILSLLLGYHCLIRIRDCSTSYFSSTNRIIYTKSYVLSSVLSVFLMIIFAGNLGMQAFGVAIGQFISQIIYNFWYWPIKCYKELKYQSLREFLDVGSREILMLCKKK